MSIILAGLYDDGAGVVMVADKGRTGINPDGTEVTFELKDVSKIKKINDNLYVLLAGDTAITIPFYDYLKEIKPNTTLDRVKELATEKYLSLKKTDLEERVLNHFGYKTLDDFKKDKTATEKFISQLNWRIMTHATDFDCIIVAKEKGSYSINVLSDFHSGTFKKQDMGHFAGGYGKVSQQIMPVLRDTLRQDMTKQQVEKILVEAMKHGRSLSPKYIGKTPDVKTLPD